MIRRMGGAKRYPSNGEADSREGFRFALLILQEGTPSHSRGARRPKGCDRRCPRNRRGRRESRVPSAPAIVRTKCTRVTARCAGTPGLPCAMVLTRIARSPRSRIPLASVADELTIPRSPVEPDKSPSARHKPRVPEPHAFAVRGFLCQNASTGSCAADRDFGEGV